MNAVRDNKHPCAVCAKPINRGLLMCVRDWRLVPKEQQTAVYRSYRAMTRAARKPEGLNTVFAYRQAREAAVRSAESQLKPINSEETSS